MKEVCIPVADLKDHERAEVEVRIPKSKQVWKYRIETCKIKSNEKDEAGDLPVENLRYIINTYDSKWELIQILNSDQTSGYVQLLYRYKK